MHAGEAAGGGTGEGEGPKPLISFGGKGGEGPGEENCYPFWTKEKGDPKPGRIPMRRIGTGDRGVPGTRVGCKGRIYLWR